jgi:hypothetical protein
LPACAVRPDVIARLLLGEAVRSSAADEDGNGVIGWKLLEWMAMMLRDARKG